MASSPISKIPNETLDRIVQYAGELTDISTLRLVSKGFYECSQPAFLDKLHYTVFDIRSTGSMKNLEELSQDKNLAPRILRLRVACNYERHMSGIFNMALTGILSDAGCEKFERLQSEDASWFPHAWKLVTSNDLTPEIGDFIQVRTL